MKKIMFNDKYGLTDAVLEGRKTMTRRMVPQSVLNAVEKYQEDYYSGALECISTKDAILNMCTGEKMFKCIYNIGEVVAVAQPYKVLDYGFHGFATNQSRSCGIRKGYAEKQKGWDNKMFVESKFMPHQIQITGIKIERLQDITDEDCLKEGLIKKPHPFVREAGWVYCMPNDSMCYVYPTQCFADLIDKVSGKGTWKSNPYVFAYTFELVK